MAELDEPIRISRYDRRWPASYEHEEARLRAALEGLDPLVEHIGSTAVPGMTAKPIVDVLVGVDPDRVTDAVERIAALGYEHLGAAGVPGRQHLRRRGADAFNVHVFERGHPLVHDDLVLRDYLRSHPEEATRYGEQKSRLLAAGNATLLSYSDAKASTLAALTERARAWDERRR